eukprot:CAMPEP_0194679486 /NCGR_PEP_ID=MMETSP0295-20121207/10811_1 /TAXON_ID=39354 /ORGANISM="Heterosigma akashiwo, Strain CCMP2393" /LENGTH=159 /DNA_ID=CAMNT_0039564879 /DNA_START=366 /DNA_END=844 /DNA_ORIENTATION=-
MLVNTSSSVLPRGLSSFVHHFSFFLMMKPKKGASTESFYCCGQHSKSFHSVLAVLPNLLARAASVPAQPPPATALTSPTTPLAAPAEEVRSPVALPTLAARPAGTAAAVPEDGRRWAVTRGAPAAAAGAAAGGSSRWKKCCKSNFPFLFNPRSSINRDS